VASRGRYESGASATRTAELTANANAPQAGLTRGPRPVLRPAARRAPAMVYVVNGALARRCLRLPQTERFLRSSGQVVQRRGWLRLSIFGELFWKTVNFVQFLCAPCPACAPLLRACPPNPASRCASPRADAAPRPPLYSFTSLITVRPLPSRARQPRLSSLQQPLRNLDRLNASLPFAAASARHRRHPPPRAAPCCRRARLAACERHEQRAGNRPQRSGVCARRWMSSVGGPARRGSALPRRDGSPGRAGGGCCGGARAGRKRA
jgi:hypothetical protein